jgi:hypothetical protein
MIRALVVLTIATATLALPQPMGDTAYYPIHVGAAWKYRVERPNRGKTVATVVTWKVTHEDRSQSPPVFQVWPNPMQTDDEAMRLRATQSGIQDIDTKAFLLRFPLKEGAVWITHEGTGARTRTSRVLSVDQPCRSGETVPLRTSRI